jgi:hypothetical protein
MDEKTQFCIYTLISLSQADIEELVVPAARGKISPITRAYKQSIYIFQVWYRDLLLKNKWDNDMKIFDLNWSQYDCFCHEYQKDKVATRDLLLKNEWDDDMKIFDLNSSSQYDCFCHEYQKDKVATMPAPAIPIVGRSDMDEGQMLKESHMYQKHLT